MEKQVAVVLYNGKKVYGFRIKGIGSGKNVGLLEAPFTPLIGDETPKKALERRLEELRIEGTIGKEIEEISDSKIAYYKGKIKAGQRVTTVEHESVLEDVPAEIVKKDWIPEQSKLLEWLKSQ